MSRLNEKARTRLGMVAYGQLSLLLSRSARRLNVVVQAGPVPLVNENIPAYKAGTLNVTHRLRYSQLLLRSCFAHWPTRGACMADGALRWKTLTSESDRLKRSSQNPLALMSRHASCVAFSERRICSPPRGCRGGSSATSLQISCSTLAVKSRNSLCCITEKPLLA